MLNWIVAGLGVFFIGLSKAGFAVGLGMLAIPMITLVIPAYETLGLILPLLCFADLCTIFVYWRQWNFSLIKFLLTGALPGIILGTSFMSSITDQWLRKSIGVIVLISLGLIILRQVWSIGETYKPKLWHALLIGLIAGFTSSLAHAAAPIIAIFLLAQKPDKTTFVATSALYFTLVNFMKVPPFVISRVLTWEIFIKSLYFFPIIPVGVLLGKVMHKQIPSQVFNYLVYVLLFIISLKLIL